MLESLFPGIQHLQNIHPLVVHFPLSFLPGAALFFFLAAILRKESLAMVAFWMLILGTVSAAAAVGTGLYAEEGVMVSFTVRNYLLEPHEKLMLATLAASVILTVWAIVARPFPRRGRPLFLFLFLSLIGIMVKGADFGGRMVYDYNAGGNACPQPIEFDK